LSDHHDDRRRSYWYRPAAFASLIEALSNNCFDLNLLLPNIKQIHNNKNH